MTIVHAYRSCTKTDNVIDTDWQRWSSWMPAPPIGCRSWSGCIWIFHRGFPWSWLCGHRTGPPPFPPRNTRCRLRAVAPSTELYHLPRQVSRHGTPEAVYQLCTKFAGSRPIGRQSVVSARCPRPGSISMLKMIREKRLSYNVVIFVFLFLTKYEIRRRNYFTWKYIRGWFCRGLIK